MKLPAAKPISSPGRAEKFPPPLMRFLRSNVGSRSRGRTRASPMFVRKKSAAMETQEPSSPKVTCMGQVRVRRSSRSNQAVAERAGPTGRRVSSGRRCGWIRRTLSCQNLCKIRAEPRRRLRQSWVAWFRRSSRRESQVRQESAWSDSKYGSTVENSEQEEAVAEEDDEEERGDREKARIFASYPNSPPRNALLLTRCRSAPYRSSSLALRFWESPLTNQETREQENQEHAEDETPSTDGRSPSSSPNHNPDEKSNFLKGSDRISADPEKLEEQPTPPEGGNSAMPRILTRCKSEPARTAENLNPELHSWRRRRLSIANSSFARVIL